MKHHAWLIALVATTCTSVPSVGWASSDEAWTQFRQDVETACLAAVAGVLENASAKVDPFGSASYGLAIVGGTDTGGGGRASFVCVYDKRARTVEIGSAIQTND